LYESKEYLDSLPKYSPLESIKVDEDRVKNFKFSRRYDSRNPKREISPSNKI
tara:strand:- start:211 stop:366 length:156 start_codon:yes stop_codon:yes gene_type:complete